MHKSLLLSLNFLILSQAQAVSWTAPVEYLYSSTENVASYVKQHWPLIVGGGIGFYWMYAKHKSEIRAVQKDLKETQDALRETKQELDNLKPKMEVQASVIDAAAEIVTNAANLRNSHHNTAIDADQSYLLPPTQSVLTLSAPDDSSTPLSQLVRNACLTSEQRRLFEVQQLNSGMNHLYANYDNFKIFKVQIIAALNHLQGVFEENLDFVATTSRGISERKLKKKFARHFSPAAQQKTFEQIIFYSYWGAKGLNQIFSPHQMIEYKKTEEKID